MHHYWRRQHLFESCWLNCQFQANCYSWSQLIAFSLKRQIDRHEGGHRQALRIDKNGGGISLSSWIWKRVGLYRVYFKVKDPPWNAKIPRLMPGSRPERPPAKHVHISTARLTPSSGAMLVITWVFRKLPRAEWGNGQWVRRFPSFHVSLGRRQ